MESGGTPEATRHAGAGPVLFAYDGSELAKFAIDAAGRQMPSGREALVVCVWQPVDVGFVPPAGQHLNAAQATEVKKAAHETAEQGASLAEQAGFRSQSAAIEAAPTWKGIVDTAGQRDASLIVLGAHRRTGLARHVLGSVTAAVLQHSPIAVLVVPERS